MTTTYTLTEDELTELVEAKNKLDALEAAGVDKWDGYNIAMDNVEDADLTVFTTNDNFNEFSFDEEDE